MKKYFFITIFVLFTGQFVLAQDLDSLMKEIAKSPNAKREVTDGATMAKTIEANMPKDTTGTLARLLPVIQKVDSMVTISTQVPDSVVNDLIKNYKISNSDSIIKVMDRNPFHVRTIAHKKDGVTTAIFIFFNVDPMMGAITKLSGKFEEADLKEMVTNRLMGN